MVISCPSEWSSVVISGHRWSSVVLSGPQWSSVVISGPHLIGSRSKARRVRVRGRVGRALTTALPLPELRPRRRRHRMDGGRVGGYHCLHLQVHRGGERPGAYRWQRSVRGHSGRANVCVSGASSVAALASAAAEQPQRPPPQQPRISRASEAQRVAGSQRRRGRTSRSERTQTCRAI